MSGLGIPGTAGSNPTCVHDMASAVIALWNTRDAAGSMRFSPGLMQGMGLETGGLLTHLSRSPTIYLAILMQCVLC